MSQSSKTSPAWQPVFIVAAFAFGCEVAAGLLSIVDAVCAAAG